MNTSKKCFNIVLNSSDTTSFNGANNNGNFYVDFGNIISADEMNKPYQVTVRFKSKQSTNLVAGDLYMLQINLLTPPKVQQNTSLSQICAILSRYADNVTVASTNGANNPQSFECYLPDNPPVYLDNLRDISQIILKITNSSNVVLANCPDYVCILNFLQV